MNPLLVVAVVLGPLLLPGNGLHVGETPKDSTAPRGARDSAPPARDPHQVDLFRKDHPCPATGKTTGACPDYRVDHIVPLCFGGADSPDNMQWQTYTDSLKKDVFERDACALKRKCQPLQGAP